MYWNLEAIGRSITVPNRPQCPSLPHQAAKIVAVYAIYKTIYLAQLAALIDLLLALAWWKTASRVAQPSLQLELKSRGTVPGLQISTRNVQSTCEVRNRVVAAVQ